MILWSNLLKIACAIFTPKDSKNRMLSLNPFANFNFLCFASSNFLKSSFVIPVILQIVVISQHLLLTGNCKFLVANPLPQKRDQKKEKSKTHKKKQKTGRKISKSPAFHVIHFFSVFFCIDYTFSSCRRFYWTTRKQVLLEIYSSFFSLFYLFSPWLISKYRHVQKNIAKFV